MTTEELLGPREFARTFAFDDISIRADGDGRTVEAYAAAFGVPAEIKDQDGHYNEELVRGSFAKTLGDNGTNFGVFYNHARTIYGTPDGNLSVPIGVPIEVREDGHGLLTVTRYLDNPLADSVLDAIKQRAIRGQSFSGRFIKSTRTRGARGQLPTITRTEVAMREYGPTVFPAYAEASILGTRSVEVFLDELARLSTEDLDRFRQMLGVTAPAAGATTDTAPAAVQLDEPAQTGHSAQRTRLNLRAQARKEGGPLT